MTLTNAIVTASCDRSDRDRLREGKSGKGCLPIGILRNIVQNHRRIARLAFAKRGIGRRQSIADSGKTRILLDQSAIGSNIGCSCGGTAGGQQQADQQSQCAAALASRSLMATPMPVFGIGAMAIVAASLPSARCSASNSRAAA